MSKHEGRICKKCGAPISKSAVVCPTCGANVKPVYKKVWFWILIVLLLIIIGFASCTASVAKSVSDNTNVISSDTTTASNAASSASSSSDSSSQSAAASSTNKYSITDETVDDSGYFFKLDGTFTNLTSKQISYVVVTYSLYDADGAQIGTANATTSNLDANGTWKFEATSSVQPDQVDSYKLSKVSGF